MLVALGAHSDHLMRPQSHMVDTPRVELSAVATTTLQVLQ